MHLFTKVKAKRLELNRVLAMNEKGAQGWTGHCRPLLIIAPAVARMASTTQMACTGMAVAWPATPTCYGMVVTDLTSSKVGQSFVLDR